jgi:hypothetical protein
MRYTRGKNTREALEISSAILWQVSRNSEPELSCRISDRPCATTVTAKKEALRRGAVNSMRKADVLLESGKYQ